MVCGQVLLFIVWFRIWIYYDGYVVWHLWLIWIFTVLILVYEGFLFSCGFSCLIRTAMVCFVDLLVLCWFFTEWKLLVGWWKIGICTVFMDLNLNLFCGGLGIVCFCVFWVLNVDCDYCFYWYDYGFSVTVHRLGVKFTCDLWS